MIFFLRYALAGGVVIASAFGFAATFGARLSDALWTVADAMNF